MKELNKSQKLNYIKSKAEEFKLTAYNLAQRTDLGEKGIKNILDGKVKAPHLSTLNILFEYLEDLNNQKSRINSVAQDPETLYENISADDILVKKITRKLLPFLQQIEEQNDEILKALYENSRAIEGVDLEFQKLKEVLKNLKKSEAKLNDLHAVIVEKK